MKFVAIGLGVVGLAAAGTVIGAMASEYNPAPIEPAEQTCESPKRSIQKDVPFEVLSWNLQYGASRKYQFFYDGGDAVHVAPEDVQWTLDAASNVMEEIDPELYLLQEVDRGSKRTGKVDQLQDYLAAADTDCWAAAPYHKSPYVPVPSGDALGKVDMELALLSHAPMSHGERIQLAMLDEARVRRMFNLKRALLWAEVQVEGLDQPLAIASTHLSAFSYGDGTLEKQVQQLNDWMAARPPGQPWILAGDMNLLPPGDDKDRLTQEADLYADESNPIEPLFQAGWQEVFGDAQLDPENRTYVSFGQAEPDRKIDYIFYGGPIHVLEAEVVRGEALEISDHLPIRAQFVIGDKPQPASEDTLAPTEPPADPVELPVDPEAPLSE